MDVFYQETNYVSLLIFWLLIDVCFLLLHVSFIFECLVYFLFIILSVLRVRFYNKINNKPDRNTLIDQKILCIEKLIIRSFHSIQYIMRLIAVSYRRCGRNLRAKLYTAINSLSANHAYLKTLYKDSVILRKAFSDETNLLSK